MKKIAAMFLGLSLMLGTTSAMFAADDTTKTKKVKTKTTKTDATKTKKTRTKKTDTSTEKKS